MAYQKHAEQKISKQGPLGRLNSYEYPFEEISCLQVFTASERFQGYLERHLVLVEVLTQKEKASVVSC